jgi:hypothetical protein
MTVVLGQVLAQSMDQEAVVELQVQDSTAQAPLLETVALERK